MRLFFLLFPILAFSQVLKGRVVDQDNKPLESASVFIAQSTARATTQADGSFSLAVPPGSWLLVVTYVGYESVVVASSQFSDFDQIQVIKLSPIAEQIREVSVMSAKDRERYLKLFKEHLLGSSRNADKSKLLNPEVVSFYYDAASRTLEAYADDPLQIEIPALNYHLELVLAQFSLNWNANLAKFEGYASYSDLRTPDEVNIRKIKKNRQTAYLGSTQHFLRTAYDDTFSDAGFVVRAFSKTPNPAYPSPEVRKALIEQYRATKIYPEELRIPEHVVTFKPGQLKWSEFVAKLRGVHSIFMDDYLEIRYLNASEEERYQTRYKRNHGHQVSQVKANRPVAFFADGTYTDVDGLVFFGYMGWKKLSDMVPNDYVPVEEE